LQTPCNQLVNDLQRFYKSHFTTCCIFVESGMSVSENRKLFEQLLAEVEAEFRKVYPAVEGPMKDWKGQDIVFFQEELIDKVHGQISEKWFYTHIKGQPEKLPREDMLNLLSKYAHYQSWRDFLAKATTPKTENLASATPSKSKTFLLVAALGMLIVSMVIWFTYRPEQQYTFCFIDADQRTPITDINIDVTVLEQNQAARMLVADSNGCITLMPKGERLIFVVNSPYYKSDTIVRNINGLNDESIRLKPDDYALMMHVISKSQMEDWKKRRRTLKSMFADNARIIQVSKDRKSTMEFYNKDEFINKLTMPLQSLKNIEVLDVQYQGDAIISMRFMQIQQIDKP